MKSQSNSMTVTELTTIYNGLADKPVKVGSLSKKELYRRIDALTPDKSKGKKAPKFGDDTISLADIARDNKLNIKVVRARFRRLRARGVDMPDLLDESRWVFNVADRNAVESIVVNKL